MNRESLIENWPRALAAVIILVALSTIFWPSDDRDESTPVDTSNVSSEESTNPSLEGYEDVTGPVGHLLTDEARSHVLETIRVFASFPNEAGRDTTLARLRPFVTEDLLASTEQAWAGPDVATASIAVTDVVIEAEAAAGEDGVVAQARVTQVISYAATPSQLVTQQVSVTVRPDSNGWIVTDLRYLTP